MGKPNIVLIQADQLAPQFLPAYGHPLIETPAISQLADEGVLFERAYSNSPLCAPSRCSMMAGVLPSRIGGYDNGAEFPASVPTLAHYLRLQGYRTCLSGKMHFIGPDQLHGFEERVTTDIYNADFNFSVVWPDNQEEGRRRDVQLSWGGNTPAVQAAGTAERTLQLDFDEEVGYQAVQKIYDYARTGDERPFFLVASFTHPHDPFIITPELWDRYRHEDIDMPAVGPIEEGLRDPLSDRIHRFLGMDADTFSETEIRTARHAYYAMVTYFDTKVAALLDALNRCGYRENTVVVLTSDHGEMLGERGLWHKRNFFEQSARVPLIVRAPGRFSSRRVDTLVSLVDLLPTLADLAGCPAEELLQPLDGKSLVGLMEGGALEAERTIRSELLCDGVDAPTVMIRRGALKFIYSKLDGGLLYHLEDDPNELEGIGTNSTRAEELGDLTEEVRGFWDLDALCEDILLSQRRRMVVNAAHGSSGVPMWDYEPRQDPSRRYMRGSIKGMGWQDDEKRAVVRVS